MRSGLRLRRSDLQYLQSLCSLRSEMRSDLRSCRSGLWQYLQSLRSLRSLHRWKSLRTIELWILRRESRLRSRWLRSRPGSDSG